MKKQEERGNGKGKERAKEKKTVLNFDKEDRGHFSLLRISQ